MRDANTGRLGERLGGKFGERLGKNEKQVLFILESNKFTTIKELSLSLKISTTAVENNLAKLKQKGMIQRVGSAKAGHWEIMESG